MILILLGLSLGPFAGHRSLSESRDGVLLNIVSN